MSENVNRIPGRREQDLSESTSLTNTSADGRMPAAADGREDRMPSDGSTSPEGASLEQLGALAGDVIITDLSEGDGKPELRKPAARYPIPSSLPSVPPAYKPQTDEGNS